MAATLRQADVDLLTRAMGSLADVAGVTAFPAAAMAACATVVPSELIAYNEIHPAY